MSGVYGDGGTKRLSTSIYDVFFSEPCSPRAGDCTTQRAGAMKDGCRAKKFAGRMKHRGSGKAVGERKMGNMTKQLSAKQSSYKQSKDGNGGR